MYSYEKCIRSCLLFFSFLSENLTEKIFFLISHREKKIFSFLHPYTRQSRDIPRGQRPWRIEEARVTGADDEDDVTTMTSSMSLITIQETKTTHCLQRAGCNPLEFWNWSRVLKKTPRRHLLDGYKAIEKSAGNMEYDWFIHFFNF